MLQSKVDQPCSVMCGLAGSSQSAMWFASLIEIAALGSGPVNLSCIWHVSPVSCRGTLPNPLLPTAVATFTVF